MDVTCLIFKPEYRIAYVDWYKNKAHQGSRLNIIDNNNNKNYGFDNSGSDTIELDDGSSFEMSGARSSYVYADLCAESIQQVIEFRNKFAEAVKVAREHGHNSLPSDEEMLLDDSAIKNLFKNLIFALSNGDKRLKRFHEGTNEVVFARDTRKEFFLDHGKFVYPHLCEEITSFDKTNLKEVPKEDKSDSSAPRIEKSLQMETNLELARSTCIVRAHNYVCNLLQDLEEQAKSCSTAEEVHALHDSFSLKSELSVATKTQECPF